MNSLNRYAICGKNVPKSKRHKPQYQRLLRFADWLDSRGLTFVDVDLVAFREYLTNRQITPDEVDAHVSDIRERYESIIDDSVILMLHLASYSSNDANNLHDYIRKCQEKINRALAGKKED